MDDRGYWHNVPRNDVMEKLTAEMSERRDERPGNDRPRYVIALDIGEAVQVTNADGAQFLATFDGAEKNRVTLTPKDGGAPLPFNELASTVTVERATGESIKAQVWDNRKGKLVLRTLPLGQL